MNCNGVAAGEWRMAQTGRRSAAPLRPAHKSQSNGHAKRRHLVAGNAPSASPRPLGERQLSTSCWLLAACGWRLAAGGWKAARGDHEWQSRSAVGWRQQVADWAPPGALALHSHCSSTGQRQSAGHCVRVTAALHCLTDALVLCSKGTQNAH